MDQSNLAASRLARPFATPDDDDTEFLAGQKVPLVKIRPASEQRGEARGRHSRGPSKDLEPIDEIAMSQYHPDVEQTGATVVRRRSPHPTSASSLFRRLSTLPSPASPIFRNRSARKALGSYNEIGDDYDVDSVPVDLSSLAGMGFEMTETPRATINDLSDQNTAYFSPASTFNKPGFTSFVKKAPRLGDGLVVGAELKFDPSKATPDRAQSSSRRPTDSDIFQRSKTVRQVGQNLAESKQTIIAVKENLDENEGIDLSSFEGSQLSHRMSNQTLDPSSSRSQESSQNTALSYFFPEDPDIPNWRPFSMSTWYISLLIGLSLGLAVFQEWLCQHSLGLAKGTPPHGILEFNEVTEVSLWNFFAWKCKLVYCAFLVDANEYRLANHDYNFLCCTGIHHGLRHSTSRAIPPAVAAAGKPRLTQPQPRSPYCFSILRATTCSSTKTVGSILFYAREHRGIDCRTLSPKSVSQLRPKPDL